MKIRKLLCAALSLALLSGAAFAAADDTASSPARPLTPPASDPAATESASFQVDSRNDDHSVRVWGTARLMEGDSVYLENSNESDTYHKIILRVGEDTVIVDAVTGEERTYADLKDGESLYAWASPVMTRSMPPQATARLIVCSIPADFGAPQYTQVQKVTRREDGGADVLVSGDLILHLNQDTELLTCRTKNVPTLSDIVPGAMVLSWHNTVAESFPAQAWPTKVMVFPSTYDGYVSAAPGSLEVNGAKVEPAANEQPFVHEGKLMVPVRRLAEALGCTVTWDAAAPSAVTVEKDGEQLYTITIGGDSIVVEGDMVSPLTTPAVAADRVTFVCIDDLLAPHNIKNVPQSTFF